MRKTSQFLFILIVISLFLFTNACKKSGILDENYISNPFNSKIYAFTSGIISKADPIRIRLAEKVVESNQIGEELANGIFSITPSVNGAVSWEDEQTLVFQPAEWLNSNTAYQVTLHLSKIIPDVASDEKEFEFSFMTREQHLDFKMNGFRAPNPQNLKNQELYGVLKTADLADNSSIENLLDASQNGKPLEVSWQHDNSGLQHIFTIAGIQRSDVASKVSLSWNGSPLEIDFKEKKDFEIPALGDFKIIDVTSVDGPDAYLSLQFSDPLLADQDVSGLVNISDFTGTLRYIVSGNELRVYTDQFLSGARKITVFPGLKNINNQKMDKASEWSVAFEEMNPQVRLVGKGVIIPESSGLIFPFEAVGLNAVEVEVFKIYNNNILQFLQTSALDEGDNYEMRRVGRVILQKKVDLQNLNPSASSNKWTRYALSLDELIKQDKGAIYQIRIGFKPEYANLACANENKNFQSTISEVPENGDDGEIASFMDQWYGPLGYYSGYDWNHREDPCFPAYYNSEKFVSRNVFASNLGLTAKTGNDNTVFVAVTDLRTAAPIGNVDLAFYDFQQQVIESAKTNGEGIALLELPKKPFFVIATQGSQKGYLRLQDGNTLSVSRFDVSGAIAQKGLKGFMYGERGVWRPGDSVFLNFILEDKANKLPDNFPIAFELYDARGQLQISRNTSENINSVYPLHFVTSPDDPTGDWIAKVKAGGATFDKVLKIETIKPNRLKIDLDFGKEVLSGTDEPISGRLQANWLHGAPAKNLAVKVEMNLKPVNTEFPKYTGFEFDDPARVFYGEPTTIFEGTVNENGAVSFQSTLLNSNAVPGNLLATFKSRIFETGGDASTDNFSIPYHPFDVYTGVEIPKNKYGSKELEVNKDGTIDFVALSEKGQPLNGRKLSVGLYRVEWRWWWDRGEDYVTQYNSTRHLDALQRTDLTTNSSGIAQWNINVNQWGRYMIRVCDNESGHCSGDFFYAGFPWYDENNPDDNFRQAAAMLSFTSNKEKYMTGEKVTLNIPTGKVGRALVSLENGTKVIKSFWVQSNEGENNFSFETTPEMAPTVYAHVSLIQPHGQPENDLPIRLYGVIPINVEDPETRLVPQIKMPETLQPEQEFTVEVSENSGKAMAYSIAVVDEGLLGLTRFKVPNPWDAFYAREALGVKTWDIYDQVLGAYGGDLERLLSIGGDLEIIRDDAKDQVNRFKPVVLHLGPFELKKGKKAKHKIKMPNYVGAVRTMVVAANKGAYGASEKTVPVKKPLMILATIPRVLSPGETFKLPVTVFAMENKVKNVKIQLKESSGKVNIIGGGTENVSFSQPGETVVYFDVQVANQTGTARFDIQASGNGENVSQQVELLVRNPNPYVTNASAYILEAGQSWTTPVIPVGMSGTNTGILEVSNIPPINLGNRLQYLLQYPYGCIEQTLSGGFPQLFVNKLVETDENQQKLITSNINATINRIKLFQTSSGGFAYWPGESDVDQWSSTYAGHFLLEAKTLGYAVPAAMINRWVAFQKNAVRLWSPNLGEYGYGDKRYNELNQAYRLYTLALAGEADLSAMNQLRETKGLSLQAKWRLATAYAIAGKPEVASSITNGLSTDVQPYNELTYSYGSDLRDRAMILEGLVLMNEKRLSAELTKYIAERLSNQSWYSTQTVAFSLLAIGKYVGTGEVSRKFTFTYKLDNGKAVNAGANVPVFQVEVPVDKGVQNVTVANTSNTTLFARLLLTGQPVAGQETAAANDLNIEVAYKSMDGLPLNPALIEQGQDFVAEVKVTNPGKRGINYQEMALTQIFPSGWEIINARMDGFEYFVNSTVPQYRDIKDDRAYSFFDISQGITHTYRVQLNATYLGRYYLPAVTCEAMYDNSIYARVPGQWVNVVAPGEL